ncbi:hypothetical protein AB1Y20_013229 [Prymnesium parvum]|uniref:Uncharacterized protein n=1 Tax=Prymnesium parvum TaxID=97485 RepID=A0AB34IK17_PRYPA
MDASYWKDVCTQALSLTRRWAAEQERSVAILAALSEFHGRLGLLERGAIGALKALPDASALLHAKHVRGLENLMSALRLATSRFEALHTELSALHGAVWERHAQCSRQEADGSVFARPSTSVAGLGCGIDAQQVGLPAVLQFIEWFQELDQMFARELLLKVQLIDSISYSMPPAQLADVHRLWTLEPNLSFASLERLSLLVDSLTVPASTSQLI